MDITAIFNELRYIGQIQARWSKRRKKIYKNQVILWWNHKLHKWVQQRKAYRQDSALACFFYCSLRTKRCRRQLCTTHSIPIPLHQICRMVFICLSISPAWKKKKKRQCFQFVCMQLRGKLLRSGSACILINYNEIVPIIFKIILCKFKRVENLFVLLSMSRFVGVRMWLPKSICCNLMRLSRQQTTWTPSLQKTHIWEILC